MKVALADYLLYATGATTQVLFLVLDVGVQLQNCEPSVHLTYHAAPSKVCFMVWMRLRNFSRLSNILAGGAWKHDLMSLP